MKRPFSFFTISKSLWVRERPRAYQESWERVTAMMYERATSVVYTVAALFSESWVRKGSFRAEMGFKLPLSGNFSRRTGFLESIALKEFLKVL